MSSVITVFARLIAQGYMTEDEALAPIEATERAEATWTLGYAVDEWRMRRGYAAVAIIEDMTAMLPCCKADAFARACTINAMPGSLGDGSMSDFAIKAKRASDKRYSFVTPGGGLNHLSVHASTFTAERAAEMVSLLRMDNPTVTFKVVDLRRKATAP